MPVEVLGLQGTPLAGDTFVVVENESRARQVSEFRQRLQRDKEAAARVRGSREDMFTKIAEARPRNCRSSSRATCRARSRRSTRRSTGSTPTKSAVRVLHSAVGGINECDVTLAKASGAHDHRLQCARQPAGARAGQARRGRDPLLLDHLQRGGRREGGAVGHAGADPAREVPRQCRDPRGLQHHQGRQGRRLHGDRRARSSAAPRCACCATTS